MPSAGEMQSPTKEQGKRAKACGIRCVLSVAKKVSYIPCIYKMARSRVHWECKSRYVVGALMERYATLKQLTIVLRLKRPLLHRTSQIIYKIMVPLTAPLKDGKAWRK